MNNDQAYEHVSNALAETKPDDYVFLARWGKTNRDDEGGESHFYWKCTDNIDELAFLFAVLVKENPVLQELFSPLVIRMAKTLKKELKVKGAE